MTEEKCQEALKHDNAYIPAPVVREWWSVPRNICKFSLVYAHGLAVDEGT